jgi:hypothetical protein
MIRQLLGVAAILSALGCQRDARRDQPTVNSSVSCAATPEQATRLGEAILHVRAARVYASTNQQRAALLELEGILRTAIATVSDSAWQASARSKAADSFFTLAAQSMRRGIDEAAAEAKTANERSDVVAALSRGYGEHLQEIAASTSFENPSSCMKEASNRANLAVLAALRSK